MIGEILGERGLLARALERYEARPAQVEMAREVLAALREGRPLVVEAGTGTGKTLAYLVPAILSGLKVVISTATKNLQEQIVRKDVPLLQRVMPVPFEVACVKGISNYLCLRRFGEQLERVGARPADGDPELAALVEWAATTASGDRADLAALADDAPLWREVSATTETRLGPRCPHFEACFVTRARRDAARADVVVVNHHLFFADLALRRAWPGAQVLPSYDAVIFDEAHQLEEIATDYFGVQVSSGRAAALARDALRHAPASAGERAADEGLATLAQALARTADAFFGQVRPRLPGAEPARLRLPEGFLGAELAAAWGRLDAAAEALALHAARAADEARQALARRAQALRDDLALVLEGRDRRFVRWGEARARATFLHASPVDVAPLLRDELLARVPAVVFTSATLTAAGAFDYFRASVGLAPDAARELRLDSPFDYATQALLYLPRDLPDPREPGFAAAVAERALELVEQSRGRAFLLFTSHRNLREVERRLRGRLSWPLLVQGEAPKHLLLERFAAAGDAVLLGSSSFWEGVDVAGAALSLVMIDKLPFSAPDDPIVAARSEAMRERGEDPFRGLQLPRAALALKQGFGRLVRGRTDRGVVALLDRRVTAAGYGRVFLDSLPRACARTHELEAVGRFFAAEEPAA